MHRQIAGKLTSPRTKWVVLAFWIAVMVVAAPIAGKLTDVEKNDTFSWLPGEAESTKVIEFQEQFQSSNTYPAVIVYERTAGLTEADQAKAEADAQKFGEFEDLDGEVTGPIVSDDGQAMETVVPLNLGSDGWNKAPDVADDLQAITDADADGMKIYLSGQLGMAADSADAFSGIDTTLLLATLIVVISLLLLTYRSPILWIFPLFSAVVALFSAEAVIYFLAKDAGLVVNAQSSGILTVLVLGAGTDYALLLVARFREELRRHEDRHEAMAVALHRAGPAIFASAGTVVVGMLCLVVAEMNSTQGLGPVAAIGIAVGLLAMLTLLPAILVIFPPWIFWPRRPHYGSDEPTAGGIWARVGRSISRRPRTVWVVTSLILAVACLGVVKLDANGLTSAEGFTSTVPSVVGQDVLTAHGLSDEGSPVVVQANEAQADEVVGVVGGTDGITEASVLATADGSAYIEAGLEDQSDSDAAYATIERLRDKLDSVSGADALVGGNTAILLDVKNASARDNKVIIPLILLVVFLILSLLLRALIAPMILIATVVLSFGAALGVSALVFHYIWDLGGADAAFPLFVFVFLVALGIDYNIFLMTRVREEALKYGTRRGALIGLAATGGVITSAGLVLAGTFAVLGSIPATFLLELGFAVAFGVLLDTMVVRSVLVTALNLEIGKRMWWPSALGHKDDVDIDQLREEDRELVG